MAEPRQKVLIVDEDIIRARRVQSVIEFMDKHDAVVTGPDDWRETMTEDLHAVFIERSLAPRHLEAVTNQAHEANPHLPKRFASTVLTRMVTRINNDGLMLI